MKTLKRSKSENTSRKAYMFMTILACIFSMSVDSQTIVESVKGNLTVHVRGMENSEGQVIVNLFRKGDDIMGKPFLRLVGKTEGPSTELSFKDLPYGNYSVFAFHDENKNDDLDHNWLNIPNEPMGYSNNWNFSLFSGMPSFEKTGFTFSKESNEITITVK